MNCLRRRQIEVLILFFDIFGLILAASPAIAPVADQELEAKDIDLHARLEANAEVAEIHLVLVRMGEQKT